MRKTVLALAVLAVGLCALAPAAPVRAMKPAETAKSTKVKYDEAKLNALEAKLAKKPKDARLKSEAAEANYQVGYAMMTNDNLPPRVKYPGALKKYRRALELNPKHAAAARDKKMIEDIYKQMGRPVPG